MEQAKNERIIVQTIHGAKTVEAEVFGGVLAVHDSTDRLSVTLTHVSSGYMMAYFKSRRTAREVAARMIEMVPAGDVAWLWKPTSRDRVRDAGSDPLFAALSGIAMKTLAVRMHNGAPVYVKV